MSEFPYRLYTEGQDPSFLLETGRGPSVRSYGDLDKFLTKVYNYFLGKGFLDILLSKSLNLITFVWVVALATILTSWVDYEILFHEGNLHEAIRFQGYHPLVVVSLVIFGAFFLWKLGLLVVETKDNWEIKQFYRQRLRIEDADLANLEWREISRKLVRVPGLCAQKENPTVLDLANRIMRRENYLITMINKDILQLSLPVPYLRKRAVMTQTLEWSLAFGIFNYVFNPENNDGLNPDVKDPSKHSTLVNGLKNRFRLMGFIGLILSPFFFLFLVIYFVFQYGEELRNRPSYFAARQWSPLSRWKFRELNELPHVFQKRLNASHPFATNYVASFADNTLVIIAKFVSFICGSTMVVLIGLGLWNDDFFQMELLEGKSTLWWITVAGGIVAVCRALIPDENTVFEPDKRMEEVVQHTHYMPKVWKGRLHTLEVLNQFTQLFEYKIVIFGIELMSVLFAPFILIFSLPQSADKIIQFFREFTVTEEGVGDICKFATFPLEENGNRKYGVESSASKRVQTKHGKMEKSFLNFKANYPDWKPSEQGEKYIATVEQSLLSNPVDSTETSRRAASMENRENFYSPTDSNEKEELENSVFALNRIHRQLFRNSLLGTTSESKLHL